MASIESKAYRLRGIPEHLNRLGVAQIISTFIPGGDQRDVDVASLALCCRTWASPRTKTATLSFKKLPDTVNGDPTAGEWPLRIPALAKSLLLDDIRLASHPVGSWQPHGKDKSFMWVRDALPQLVPNVKFILYGYDTRLAESKSFQTVSDIALSFIHTLQQGGWTSSGHRRLLFFAHSLGGIVLKESLSYIILEGQSNRDALIKEISTESLFIERLEEQFSGISHLQNMKLLWAYETKTTHVVVVHLAVFVSRLSATSQRCDFDSGSTIQINANHSDMVRFSQGNELIDRIAYKLQNMLGGDVAKAGEEASNPAIGPTTAFRENNQRVQVLVNHVDPALDAEFRNINSIIQSIRAPKRDSRLEQIDAAVGHSFHWAFDKSSVGLTSWLQNDEKLFWISGKPASGKSTFMKYLHSHPLTSEYLRTWYRRDNRVRASFFFHHRGTAIQKSLEGLYLAILSQTLEQAPQLFLMIQPILTLSYQTVMHKSKLGSLSLDLEDLVKFCMVDQDPDISRQFQKLLLYPFQQVYLRRDDLLAVYNSDKINKIDKCHEPHYTDFIVSKIERPWARTREFISLLNNWLGVFDPEEQFSMFKGLLMARGRRKRTHSVHIERQLAKLLHQAINRIANQRLIDLDFCIFIDALDEHDGPPEFISRCIKEIVSFEGSHTRIKILFSSRPWHIQIHDFTEDDICDLCLQMILPNKPGSAEVLRLTEEIIKRARGVFLWVKLVLNDLLEEADTLIVSGRDVKDIQAALLEILNSLFNDLGQYYKTIIERIPYSSRWEAYCLLEVVSKATEAIYLSQISDILLCAMVQDIKDVSRQEHAPRRYTKEQLRTHSGGLIEIVRSDELQLLHQTLVEFVQLPEFRNLILGERCRMTEENGVSMLLKYKVLGFYTRFTQPPSLRASVVMSKATTKKRVYPLFKGLSLIVPAEVKDFPKYLRNAYYSTLETAPLGGLKLLLKDTLEYDKGASSTTEAPLVFLVFMHMIESRQVPGLLVLMDYLHYNAILETTEHQIHMKSAIDFCRRVRTAFFSPRCNFDICMGGFVLRHTNSHFSELMVSHSAVQALHISSHYDITKYLVENGADSNGTTSNMLTPLDCWVKSLRNCKSCLNNRSAVALLIQHGGRLNTSTKPEWKES
ncbi:hypothetical protein V8C37DRAFT_410308 [Trichoderma ceciliae]